MNYLAHLLLAGGSSLEQMGNLAGDFAKGILRDQYHPDIKKGLTHHRAIDTYTDQHPIVRRSKARFERRRVAGILVDLSFDHFLSTSWQHYSDQPIKVFVQQVHTALKFHHHRLPPSLQRVAPMMIQQNWLLSYGDLEQLDDIINRVAGRLSKPHLLIGGIADIRMSYDELRSDFEEFFPDAMRFSQQWQQDSYSPDSSSTASSAAPSDKTS